MQFRKEASVGIGAILGLQILLSMLSIVLLTRMGPAIERILEENVYSAEAVEQMALSLATHPFGQPRGQVPVVFDAAFERARSNITEEAERPAIRTIQEHHVAAFSGDEEAHDRVAVALRTLGDVNRESMRAAHVRAQRMGQRGAWGAALIGALALALGVLVYRRLRLRFELPLASFQRATARIRGGNVQVRFSEAEGPHELTKAAEDLNWLLDRWMLASRRAGTGEPTARDVELRRLVAWLLDRSGEPMIIVDAAGNRIAASQQALEVVAGEGSGDDGRHATQTKSPVPHENDWTAVSIDGTTLTAHSRSAVDSGGR